MTDLHMAVDTKGHNAARFSLEAIDTLKVAAEEALRHWDQIMTLKRRIGVPDDYRPKLLHPLRVPEVLSDEKHRILVVSFENMTPQDERFLRRKFHLNPMEDYIDARLEQEVTTSMRVDLFYQTADCRLIPMKKACHSSPFAI